MHKTLAVTALATGAMAASSCKGGTISNIDDLSGCSTISGNLILGSSVSGDVNLPSTLTKINGNFQVANAPVRSLTSSIKTISGDFTLNNLTQLNALTMDSLESVGKTLDWKVLPALGQVSMAVQEVSDVTITDTFLSNMNNNLNLSSVSTVSITNNARLVQFNSTISEITTIMTLQANGKDMIVGMPYLEKAANLTVWNASSIDCPKLKTLSGSLDLKSNTFKSVNFPTTSCGGLTIDNNPKLTSLKFSKLTKIDGSFDIRNNTALQTIDGFGQLGRVTGGLELLGSFDNFSIPKIDVDGTGKIVSTEEITKSCDKMKNVASANGWGDRLTTCEGKVADANSGGDGSGDSSDSDSAASPISGSLAMVVSLAALGAMFTAFL